MPVRPLPPTIATPSGTAPSRSLGAPSGIAVTVVASSSVAMSTATVPLSTHAAWWKWGAASALFALVLPLAYLFLAKTAIGAVERKIMDSVTDAEKVNWTLILFATPLLLVVGFVVFLWAARGVKALGFLAKYKVKPPVAQPTPMPAQG